MSKRNDNAQAQIRIQRSIALENAVLHGSLQKVADVLADGGPFGFTGRAMAYAILQGSPDKVKLLYEAGVRLKRTSSLTDQEAFGNVDYELCLVDGREIRRTVNSAQWVASLRFLREKEDSGVRWGRVYCYALMLHQTALFEVFQPEPPQGCWKEGNRLWARYWENHPDPMGLAQRLADCAREEPLPVTARMMACWPEAFLRENIWERCRPSRISRVGVLQDLVKRRQLQALDFALRLGWMQEGKAEELLALAEGDAEITALLLEQCQRIRDPEAQARRFRREQQALSRRETETQRLRRLWTARKQPDGTLMLRKYKGPDGDISMPAAIGRSQVSSLADKLFQGRFIRHCVLPESLRTIGKCTFAMSALETLHMPNAVSDIPAQCFADCGDLQAITLPNGLKRIREEAFSGCRALWEITLPDETDFLGDRAFSGCTALRRISLPAYLKDVPTQCFEDCAALAETSLPVGLVRIGPRAFAGCESFDVPSWPETLMALGEGAFKGAGITAAEVPAGVKTLRAETFAACARLRAVHMAGVEEIGFRAFADCPLLETVTLPQGLKTIGPMAFSGCTGLREIHLPAGVMHIAEDAFEGCLSLTIYAPGGSIAAGFAKHEGFRDGKQGRTGSVEGKTNLSMAVNRHESI